MAAENEIIAIYKADIEQYKAQIAAMGEVNKQAEKSQDGVTASTEKFTTKTKSAAAAIKTIGNGLGGITGLLAITGRLIGVDTQKLQELVVASQQFASIAKKLVDAQKLANVATTQGTAAKDAATQATARMAASTSAAIPIIGAIVVAIGAAAAVLIRYQDQIFGVTDAQKKKMEADDGALISDEKLRQQYNESIKTIRDLGIEYRLVTGQITEYQATVERLSVKNNESIEQIKKDTKVKTDEIIGFWAQVQLSVARGIGLGAFEQQKIFDELGRALEDRNTLIKQKEKELSEEQKVALARRFAEIDKETEELLKKERERLEKIRVERKKAADKLEEDRKNQHLENIRAAIKANAELLKAEEDALEKKRKDEQAEADEIREMNQKNDELTAEDLKQRREKEKADAKKLQEERVDAVIKANEIIFKAYEEAFNKRQELLDKEISAQENNIETQRRLAESGLDNTLAFEQRRAAELRREQQKEVETAKRVKLLETFLNSLAEFSKDDPKTALSRALLQVALAQAATAVFAEDGGIIGEIGERSNLSRRHRGGGDVLLHAQTGEGILSRKEMDNLGRRNFHLLKDAARFPIRDDVFAMPQLAIAAGSSVSNAEVVKELQAIKHGLKNIRQNNYNLDEFGNYVKTQIEQGVTTITKGKLKKPRFG